VHFSARRLPAGRAVRRAPRVARASPAGCATAARPAASRRRGTADEQAQRSIVGSFLRALAQRPRMNGAKHGAARTIDNCDDDLGAARRIEHDPVEGRAAVGDRDELAYMSRLRGRSVLALRLIDSIARPRGRLR
jgi:hypothetical protein